jgi:hypothetical protein
LVAEAADDAVPAPVAYPALVALVAEAADEADPANVAKAAVVEFPD